MMMPGCIVMLNDFPGGKRFGQVVRVERCEIEFKLLRGTECAVIRNWLKAVLSGKLIVVLPPPNGDNLKKTLVIPVSESRKRPTFLHKVIAGIKRMKYYKSTSGKWVLKTCVTGSLFIDGWFIPDPGQAIKEPMYFEIRNHINSKEMQLAQKIFKVYA